MAAKAAKQMSEKSVMGDFPVFDIESFLGSKKGSVGVEEKKDAGTVSSAESTWKEACAGIAEQLHKNGILIVKDPRVSMQDNDTFIDMMEQYFEQPTDVKFKDQRPDLFYQVGVTPGKVEKARNNCSKVAKLADDAKPLSICPPEVDPKWRFFWRIGERPKETKFKQLNANDVHPEAFPQWDSVMNKWGNKLIDTVRAVAEMAAIGFDLEPDSFTKLMFQGPHLLAPTGSNLYKYKDLGTVFANYHADLNFMTIHGKSRYPGLFVWTREGKKVMVRVPKGCLLLQAGMQFEYLTGGHVLAGYHEVVIAPETLKVIEKRKADKKSLWRVSSTLFSHVASDNKLSPIGKFATDEAKEKYPPVYAGQQVQNELEAIKLGKQ